MHLLWIFICLNPTDVELNYFVYHLHRFVNNLTSPLRGSVAPPFSGKMTPLDLFDIYLCIFDTCCHEFIKIVCNRCEVTQDGLNFEQVKLP
jgi:hypothetical protein